MEPEECRSAARHHSSKEMNNKDPQIPKSPHWLTDGFSLGFRIVAPLAEPTEAEKNRFWNVDDPLTSTVLERDREHREIIVKPDAPVTGPTPPNPK